ncbi:MAG TPA: uroporphyrinogen decarboxylase [Actinomycetota bacterium]|jgi:uroporphyrinogen decarboxylase|nr:uroporphyrinogen decarboxylase [Actinomycetota bacterium]
MNKRFLTVCRGEVSDVTPVWFMRQAGRSLPEYRALRATHDILSLCRTPDLAAEVTLQPVRRLGVDAAILFSDIVVPLEAMGVGLKIVPGVGPVIESPLTDETGIDALAPLTPEEGVPYVLETIGILRGELDVPLIGFAGAPFTLASYLIEGGPSKNHARAKALMYGAPAVWHRLMDVLAGAMLEYLRAQVDAGCQAIQLFDSWAGHLGPKEYEDFVLPAVRRILGGLEAAGVPRIVFGVTTGELLGLLAQSGADVVGVDWRTPLDVARTRTGGSVILQGNLDPAVCLAPWDTVRSHAGEVLQRGGGRGHVFNLGHGVLPETDPGTLQRLVDFVHEWRPNA